MTAGGIAVVGRKMPFDGTRVRRCRQLRGMSAPRLLALIRRQGHELSLSALTAIERGETGPRPETALAIARALDRTVRSFDPIEPDAPEQYGEA